MAPVSLDDLQPLFDQFRGDGQVLSCYSEMAGADGFHHFWQAAFDTQAEKLRKAVGHAEPARKELERNLADVRNVLESPPADSRWIAVFTAHQRGFLRTYRLDVPVRAELVAHPTPYLVPLLAAIHRRREYLVVHTDTHRGRLYAATPGGQRLIDAVDAEVPSKQHSSGELWGWGQATIARHREDAISHYQKNLVNWIEKAWDQTAYSGLILLGPHPVLEHIRKSLPKRLAAHVAHEVPESWYETAAEAARFLHDVVVKTFAEDEVKALSGLWDRLAEKRAVAAGPLEILAAIEAGRIGSDGHGFLVLGPDPRETVGRCTQCRALAVDAPPTCPRCQAPCVEASLWEEVLLLALRHRMTVRFVDEPERLAAFGGMVAAFAKGNAPDGAQHASLQSAGRT